ncbi:hypothetical protein [Halosimplex salinum]|uniref:hypothetical protein n=1 Tax=Halosimplex salinum TaxID=1710538 RepID=UPI000F473A9E|nr:hypothetical protein [Halosimplex salinum]
MGLIDFTIGKPTSDRTDPAESDDAEPSTVEVEPEPEPAAEPEPEPDRAAEPGGRLRRAARLTGFLAVGVVGLLTVRKLRSRRAETGRDDDPMESRFDDAAESSIDEPTE